MNPRRRRRQRRDRTERRWLERGWVSNTAELARIGINRIPYGATIYVRSTGGFYMLDRNYKP